MKKLPLSKIRRDGGTQTRAMLDLDTIEDYAELMEAGTKFPPVTVFYDGSEYWLADGFHRVNGAETCGLEEIECDIKQGTQRDAILYSVGANAANGLRRTNADKRRAVETLLNDETWAKWPSNKIAKACAVSHTLVDEMRRILQPLQDKQPKLVERNGTVYEQKPRARNVTEITDAREPEPQEPQTDTVFDKALRGDITTEEAREQNWGKPLTREQLLDAIAEKARELYFKLASLESAKRIPEFAALGAALAKLDGN